MMMRDLPLPDNPDSLIGDFTAYEYTLEDLGLPTAEKIYESVKEIESEVGLRGFCTKGIEHDHYQGISLTYNPNYIGSHTSKYHQTLGDKQMYGSVSYKQNLDASPDMYVGVDSYYDSYGFNQIHPLIYNKLKNVFDRLQGAVVRSRIAYLYSKDLDLNNPDLFWHKDEPAWEMFRLVIPLKTSDNFVIQINGKDNASGNELHDYQFTPKVGKLYLWNNFMLHRQYPLENKEEDDPRIYMIIGLSPWFDLVDGKFVPNENWGWPVETIVKNQFFIRDM